MYRIIVITLCLCSFQLIGQEALEPLGINPNLTRKAKTWNRSIDMTYIYAIDTINIPFKDDFSRDRFKKFDAKPTDANVSDTMFYHIWNAGVPDVDTAHYMLDTTYNYVYTPTAKPDSFQIDTFPLDTIGMRTFCDLNSYPVTCVTVPVWPPYNTDDTVGTTASPDNIYIISPPDEIQDSAIVYFVAATDVNSLWQDNFAYWNNDYAINPPTIGVATFDGLNENGYPYDFSTAFTQGKADYLTSKPFFLGSNSVSDSIHLTFYYQPKGLGNEPEKEDSLVVQFWSPNDNQWFSVWKTDTVIIDSNFRQANIKITDSKFLNDGFKFRFLNYSTLSGSFDHWHIDYVYMDKNRFWADTIRDDVAFQYPIQTLIKNYTSMPWKHFKWDPSNLMLDSLIVFQRNNNSGGKLIGGNDVNIYYQGAFQQNINNPNTPSYSGYTNFETPFGIKPLAYFYDTMVSQISATFEVEAIHNTTPDRLRTNDTIYYNQVFEDYYSYDDGTAEAAYGVQGLGGLNSKIASKYFLQNGDTIKSVFIHFTPSAYNMSSTNFTITIWDDASGKPGNVIYEKTTLDVPRYNIGVNGFYEYPMDSNHYLNSGVYYIGISQTTPDRINIGFDKNINNRFNTFYNSNGTWAISGFEGSLMIRPSFVYQKDYWVGVSEEKVTKPSLTLFPNPAQSILNIKLSEDLSNFQLYVFDITGKAIFTGNAVNRIDVSNYKPGVYMVRLQNENGVSVMSKFVKN